MVDYFNQLDGSFSPVLRYVYSLSERPGVVAANVFVSLFNATAGTNERKVFLVGGIGVSCVAGAASTAVAPMRSYRVSTATGGTLVAASAICKMNTKFPDPVGVIRIGNPTVTLGQPMTNTPPIITAGLGGATVVHDLDVSQAPLVLMPDEGVCFRTASGDLDQRWNIAIYWGELRA